MFQFFSVSAFQFFAALVALAWLWWRLIDHLRIEWSVNPQYTYGWAVPFLCLFLLWRNALHTPSSASPSPPRSGTTADREAAGGIHGREGSQSRASGRERVIGQGEVSNSPNPTFSFPAFQLSAFRDRPLRHLPSSIFYLLIIAAALLYLPTRLVQEANPDWRLVSWALALEVVTITLCLISTFQHFSLLAFPDPSLSASTGERAGVRCSPPSAPRSAFQCFSISAFVFPVCFFLVAVPWPTFIEGPLIQFLTRANAAITIELLNTFGIPALQRGNVIEISTGLVGIDDACSGIRSFQATLMISLFLGELYRLSGLRRLALVGAGFTLAFLFNVGRTLLLVTVAAKKGVPAISQWHDPTGVTILVGCFVSLWLLGIFLRNKPPSPPQSGRGQGEVSTLPTPISQLRSPNSHLPSAISLCVWLLMVEAGTEFWYRSHEKQLAAAVDWQPSLTGAEAGFKELPISENARRMLRYDSGQNAAWLNPDGSQWQMIFLRWNGGRVAAHLARSHTPEVCLSAAGHELKNVSDVKLVSVHGVSLPFRLYTFQNNNTPLFVFYCLREDRDRADAFTTQMLTYDNRFAAVKAGRRNLGQRSLEIAIWGPPDAAAAEAALREQLEKLITVK